MYSLDHAVERASCPFRIVRHAKLTRRPWAVFDSRDGGTHFFRTSAEAAAKYNALVSDWLASGKVRA